MTTQTQENTTTPELDENKKEESKIKNCEHCFEKTQNCICVWATCAECQKRIPESMASEYRGRIWCEQGHDSEEQVAKREYERDEVMKVTNASILSQRNGEFINNPKKYNIGNVASDGLPIMKINEPQVLKDYEGR